MIFPSVRDLAVGAIYRVADGIPVPHKFLFDGVPLLPRTGIDDASERSAFPERPAFDARYPDAHRYVFRGTAVEKRAVSDAAHAVGDGYIRKRSAAFERRFFDTRYAGGNGYARERNAARKRIIFYCADAGRQIDFRKRGAAAERGGADARYAFGNLCSSAIFERVPFYDALSCGLYIISNTVQESRLLKDGFS